jgi:signal transduction histidine kinase
MGKYLNKEQIFDAEDGEDMYANEEQLVARLDFFEKQLMDQTADTVVEDKINTLLEIARIQVERYKGADAWERAMTAFDLAKENELWELATEACDAMFLSETLLYPVKAITRRLARMNENFLEQIDTENLPDEFVPLGESVNKLIDRIQNFVKYQKELFIGTAHELKTPLAVIKLKNQVTLIKKRSPEEYIDALKTTNKTIDEVCYIDSDGTEFTLRDIFEDGNLLNNPYF